MLERTPDRIIALLMTAMVLVGLYGLVELPPQAQVVIHFNARGEPDGRTASRWGLFAMPLIALALWVLMPLLRRLEPRAENLARSQKAVDVITVALVALHAAMQVWIVAASLGTWRLPSNGYLVALGALFVVMGNVLGKLRPNHIVGIRTPWTLASDRVWDQTHRFGGKVFVVAGTVLALTPVIPAARGWEGPILLVVTLVSATLTIWRSHQLWRDLQR